MDLSKIILIGFMGSGKTAIGAIMAKELDRPFLDLDRIIEEKEGLKIKEIFATKGEAYFRLVETKCLKKALADKRSLVLALGGGTPCNQENIELILNFETVYLKCPIAVLADRLWIEKAKRPLISLLENKKAIYTYVQKTLSARKMYYKQAHIIVWNLGKAEEVLKRILKRI